MLRKPGITRRVLMLFLLLTLLVGGVLHSPVQADLFVFKDGYILQGKVKTESVTEFDKEGGDMITRRSGFMYVDDSVRRTVFTEIQIRHIQPKERPNEIRFINKNGIRILNPKNPPALDDVMESTTFNKDWERIIKYRSGKGTLSIKQRAGFLTPSFTRIDATQFYNWNAFYMTQELGLEVVKGLVSSHPEMKDSPEIKPEERVKRRYRYSDFFAQAGWLDESEAELKRILKEYPQEKNRVEAGIAAVHRLRAQDQLETIKRMHLAGQFSGVREQIERFPEKEADNKTLSDLVELRSDYESAQKKMLEINRHLEALSGEVAGGRQTLFKAMASEIRNDLGPDQVGRLETFLSQAAQAERQKQSGQTALDPADLLSLAVTGWLLGSSSSEAKPARAEQLWQARAMILQYLATHDEIRRDMLLKDYQSRLEAIPLDEMMQIIPNLPPPSPEAKYDSGVTEVRARVPQSNQTVTYLLKLPPEYRHGRSYPVLILLHREDEKANEMLERWSAQAAEQGYILVAPRWHLGLGSVYGYTDQEQNTVLTALLDLRKRFNVDSDRVFLFGLGQGANMVLDVGLSHPDIFAGIMPMSGGPDLFVWRYWRNAQNLPLYLITGDTSGENEKKLRDFVRNCSLAGFPVLWSRYRGRGMEWFGGEIPNLFDWMRGKRRAFPRQQLGSDGLGGPGGREFCTMRQSDRNFYWLEVGDIHPSCLNSASNWNKNANPATLTAKIDPNNNDVQVQVFGVKKGSVLFGRNLLGQNMINFDKPVNVYVNKEIVWRNKKLTPNFKVLLEALYHSGDRQRLYLARVDFKL